MRSNARPSASNKSSVRAPANSAGSRKQRAKSARAADVDRGASRRKAAKATRRLRGRRRISTNLKVTLSVIGVAVVALLVTAMVSGGNSADTSSAILVRDDSHRITTAADSKVTVVEFLDFECEYCGAAYPGVEKLRSEYRGKITYVVRYYPIESHRNAKNAAHAAEAAARQGKFEQMYKKLFETQKQWGEQQYSQAQLFESFASGLGLDMPTYRADVRSSAVAARVDKDVTDGQTAGVQGTPSFFINGTKLTGQPDYATLKTAIDKALG